MARPKMKFKPEVAVELINELCRKIDDYEFCQSVLVKEPGIQYVAPYAAKEALAPLIEQY